MAKFTKQQVFEMCERIAPKHSFESKLIYAVCLQEGGKDKDGTFAPDMARLEQGFYRRYVEDNLELATTSEILLAASYGIMQMMGLSLKEAGYFEWYYGQCNDMKRMRLGSPLSQIAIPSAIDDYVINLDWMIEWGCRWMDKKRKLANGQTVRMLGLWNGDTSGKYANEVLNRYNNL